MNRTKNHRMSVLAVAMLAGLSISVSSMAQAPSTGNAAPKPQPQVQPGQAPQPTKVQTKDAPHGGPAQPVANSPLKFDVVHVDLGKIGDQDKARAEWKFKNITDAAVTIRTVRASCGCTTPQLTKKTYEPGEEGVITAEFDPKGRRGDQDKTVTIEMEDKNFGPIPLTLHAFVQALAWVDPQKIHFPETQNGVGGKQEVMLFGRGADFKITEIKTDAPSEHLVIEQGKAKEVEVDGEMVWQIPLEVVLRESAPIGGHLTTFRIETNDDRVSDLMLTASAQVVGDARATPPRIALRVTTPDTAFSKQIQIDSRSGGPLEIVGVEAEGPAEMNLAVDFELSKEAGRSVFLVTLTGMTPAASGATQGKVMVHTTNPDDKTGKIEVLEIPFYASIQGPKQPVQSQIKTVPVGEAGSQPGTGATGAAPGVGAKPPAKGD